MKVIAFLAVLACGPALAQQTCPLDTKEPGIVARIGNTRSVIELHRKDAAPNASPECYISLDCQVRDGALKGIDYELATLAGPKVSPKFHQVRRVTFSFTDAGTQTCNAVTVLQPQQRIKIDRLPK